MAGNSIHRIYRAVLFCLLCVTISCTEQPASDGRFSRQKSSNIRADLEKQSESKSQDDYWKIHLHDVASEAGLDFQYYNDQESGNTFLPETIGGGIAAFDYDLDGWCDLYFANGRSLPADRPQSEFNDQLFRNVGGKFQNASDTAFIREFDFTHGCAIGDFNADGFEDIFVANGRCGRLFFNLGDGTLQEIVRVEHPGSSALWVAALMVDVDDDALPDLLLASYGEWDIDTPLATYTYGPGYPLPATLPAGSLLVAKNHANGKFEILSSESEFPGAVKCLGIAAVDLDLDLKPEIYVANDAIPNLCFSRSTTLLDETSATNVMQTTASERVSSLGWREIAEAAGIASGYDGSQEASMCVTPADFDRDGLPDIYLTNYIYAKNTLYHNLGNLQFQDISISTRNDLIGNAYVGWGCVPLDLDLDGAWDLLIANGHIISPTAPNAQMPCQVVQNSEGIFYDVSARSGAFFQRKANSRSVATIDFDNDGIVEAVVLHLDAPVSLLKSGNALNRNWICLEVGDWKQRSLVGGRIEMTVDRRTTAIPFVGGGSYLSQSQNRWTLGLGDSYTGTITIRVFWSHGEIDEWTIDDSNSRWRFLPGRKQRF